ncbi:CBS domain-containing protein [Pacificimonas sp. ICDLI1SI03]
MNIGSIVEGRRDVISARPDQPVAEVIGILVQHRIGAVLIMDGDRIEGILSERDVVRCIGERGESILSEPARAIMTADVITAAPKDSIAAAMASMTRRRIRHLPVLDGGRLVGIVSIGDLVKHRIEEAEREASALKDYIQHA